MTIYRQELAIKLLVLVVSIYAHVHSISPSLTSHFVFIVSIPSIDSVIRSKRRDFFHASLITQFTSPLVCQSMLQKSITLQILCGGLLRQVASRSAAPSVSFLPLSFRTDSSTPCGTCTGKVRWDKLGASGEPPPYSCSDSRELIVIILVMMPTLSSLVNSLSRLQYARIDFEI